MKVRFYNFSKKRNSTALPSSSYTEKDVRWKEATSVHDPVVEISGGPNTSFTYAYIPDWDKYYFVEDYTTVDYSRTEYSLTEDAMGSHKTEIGATKARIAFCSGLWWQNIPDPRMVVKTSKTINISTGDSAKNVLNTTGCYLMTVLGNSAGAGGFGTSYLLDEANMQKVRQWVCGVTGVAQAIREFFNGNLASGVLGISWLPFTLLTNHADCTAVSSIIIGERNSASDGVSITAYRLDKFVTVTDSDKFVIHKKYTKDDFRAIEPYTSGSIFLPGVGLVELSMSDLVQSDKVQVDWAKEYPTGNLIYTIRNGDTDIIQTVSACVAAQCPLGQMNGNGVGAVSSVKTIVAGAASAAIGMATGGAGAAVAAGAGAMLMGASNAVLSVNQRAASIAGSIGSRFFQQTNPVYVEYAVNTEDIDDSANYIAVRGRPLGEIQLISNCSGFIQCDDASVTISGSDRERNEINEMLNSGFYYE